VSFSPRNRELQELAMSSSLLLIDPRIQAISTLRWAQPTRSLRLSNASPTLPNDNRMFALPAATAKSNDVEGGSRMAFESDGGSPISA
jgi:hypothetical protein